MASAMKWLAFAICVAGLVWGPFARTFEDVRRYGYMADIMPSDWRATNIWLDSTECTVSRGVWLAVCENGKLIPISERAIADDPGHALLLSAWAAITGKRATLVDVARLSTLLNTIGLVALAGLLFSLRAWITSIVLLALGPAEFLGWMGTSPHWAFIGMVSLAGILPLAIATRRGWAWIGSGIVALAVVTLVRESIGLMGFALTLGAVATLAILQRPRPVGAFLHFALVILLAAGALLAPKWATLARDAALPMAPAERLQTHGLSHTLYLGLGFVENKWGIRYDDDYGEDLANKAGIVFCSPEYFRLMWRLYIGRIVEDPVEVVRIYWEKATQLLAVPTLHPGPPFGIVLAIGVVHIVVSTWFGLWRRVGFPQGLPIEALSLAFLGLFLAQAMVALPSHMYAVPVNAFILVLFGAIVEFAVRSLATVLSRRLRPT
ncbi:hypothetical protein [uncultured Reyranella sp.]|uniref:hypothetical protein n=1 Tax=uncultured Reyranella sp. TaxID=735512 RepID=UPI0025D2695E|nr:hypothetical protein [uncultured Reyranella sp.]